MGVGGLAALAAAAVALAACGSTTPANAPPQQAVSEAFRSIGSQTGATLHVSLGVTGKQLQQITAGDRSHGSQGSHALTATAANDIAATSLIVDVNRAGADDQFGLAVHVGTAPAAKSDPVELRYVNQTFYLRADLPTLEKDLDQSPGAVSGFQNALESPDANNSVPGLSALGQGNWVSVPASELTALLQAAGGSSSSASGQQMQQMWTQLRNAFSDNVTYTKVGTHDGRTHYTARLALKPFVQDVQQSLPASLGSIPGASSVGKQLNDAIGQLGNRKLVADVWVSDNKVQEIDVDLNQFDHKYGFAVPLRIQIGPGAPVVAPSGATPLDLSKLGGMLGGMLSGGSST
jgi:hypothetical protein